jgi:hypothetical protein
MNTADYKIAHRHALPDEHGADLHATPRPGAMGARQRQDFLFHKTTGLFAASVLVMLAGIIVSLTIGAWPALREFGPGFVTRVEWDPVNERRHAGDSIHCAGRRGSDQLWRRTVSY